MYIHKKKKNLAQSNGSLNLLFAMSGLQSAKSVKFLNVLVAADGDRNEGCLIKLCKHRCDENILIYHLESSSDSVNVPSFVLSDNRLIPSMNKR